MTVSDISFAEVARGPWTDLVVTVTILDTNNNPVSGAAVTGLLFRTGASWGLSGTTNSLGQISWKLQGALIGTQYCARVDSVVKSGMTYDFTLSPEYNPPAETAPQDCHTVVGA